ncbi:MAG: alpha/beta hydrolase [Bacteroidales bacterium]|nr:alpha/beta hydrolase [Bacteroidales bacterium]MCF8391330.1 alpha/beta hydrolase [Bacteroidales bacterium]
MQFVDFKNTRIRYKCLGNSNNPSVILLHGYLESLSIWDGFAEKLSENFFVVMPDIPGHGESEIFSPVHSMDNLAEAVCFVSDSLALKKTHIVGHSMGGYVAMAFRELFASSVISCVLFHSTCFSDTPEKRKNRDREIMLIKKGKKELIVNTNIPRAFADDNLNVFHHEIEQAKEIALKTSDEGIISILNGMKARPDRCDLLKDDNIPTLIIAGEKDNYIPIDVIPKLQEMGKNIEVEILKNSGHMGFIEERERSVEVLIRFFEKHS